MTKRILSVKEYWKYKLQKTSDPINKTGCGPFSKGPREMAEFVVIWIGPGLILVWEFLGERFREGVHT
jgi:hypothetical protein